MCVDWTILPFGEGGVPMRLATLSLSRGGPFSPSSSFYRKSNCPLFFASVSKVTEKVSPKVVSLVPFTHGRRKSEKSKNNSSFLSDPPCNFGTLRPTPHEREREHTHPFPLLFFSLFAAGLGKVCSLVHFPKSCKFVLQSLQL